MLDLYPGERPGSIWLTLLCLNDFTKAKSRSPKFRELARFMRRKPSNVSRDLLLLQCSALVKSSRTGWKITAKGEAVRRLTPEQRTWLMVGDTELFIKPRWFHDDVL